MNILIKKILEERIIMLGKEVINKISRISNGIESKKECYICNRTFNHFTKFRGGLKTKSEFRKSLQIVGSDVDNFGCMYCGSHDRERHLYMYFDKLNIWPKLKDAKILYFAPERNLPAKISEQSPLECITADLHPKTEDVKKIDATKVPFSDEKFDFVIANHILEHIPNYSKALSEFYRVLKPGGVAILQTPYSKILKNNFEDENLDAGYLTEIVEGPVATYDSTFNTVRLGGLVSCDITKKINVEAEIAFIPYLSVETDALWILRDYPFQQEADGTGGIMKLKASYALFDHFSLYIS